MVPSFQTWWPTFCYIFSLVSAHPLKDLASLYARSRCLFKSGPWMERTPRWVVRCWAVPYKRKKTAHQEDSFLVWWAFSLALSFLGLKRAVWFLITSALTTNPFKEMQMPYHALIKGSTYRLYHHAASGLLCRTVSWKDDGLWVTLSLLHMTQDRHNPNHLPPTPHSWPWRPH